MPGNTSESICQIPLGMNRAGMIFMGGLNPVAVAVEEGIACFLPHNARI